MCKKIILIRRSLSNQNKYCACASDGTPIKVFNRLSEVRKYWQEEIKLGYVQLVRELDKYHPDLEKIDNNLKMLQSFAALYKNNF